MRTAYSVIPSQRREDRNQRVMPISPTLANTFQHSQLIIILALAAVSASGREEFHAALCLPAQWFCIGAETSIFARRGALLPLCAALLLLGLPLFQEIAFEVLCLGPRKVCARRLLE